MKVFTTNIYIKRDNTFLVYQKLENKAIEIRNYTRVKDISLPGDELKDEKVVKQRKHILKKTQNTEVETISNFVGEAGLGQVKIKKIGIYWRNKFDETQYCVEIQAQSGEKIKGYMIKPKLMVISFQSE